MSSSWIRNIEFILMKNGIFGNFLQPRGAVKDSSKSFLSGESAFTLLFARQLSLNEHHLQWKDVGFIKMLINDVFYQSL